MGKVNWNEHGRRIGRWFVGSLPISLLARYFYNANNANKADSHDKVINDITIYNFEIQQNFNFYQGPSGDPKPPPPCHPPDIRSEPYHQKKSA